MHPEIDFNKIATAYVKSYSDEVLSGIKSLAQKFSNKVRSRLENTYKEYLSNLYSANHSVKSFIITEEPCSIYDFYTHLDLKSGDLTLENVCINQLLNNSSHSIIMGAAGSGKTMLMRMLLLQSIEGTGKLPIFIELRKKVKNKTPLFDRIFRSISDYSKKINKEIVSTAINDGRLVLFLDGFDELTLSEQDFLSNEIDQFITQNPKINIILSCRPDRGVKSWQKFTTFSVQPLSLDSAIDLIDKIPRFHDIKEKFKNALNSELYNTYKEFTSNPLLLTIMFISYSRSPKFTPKTSVFFKNAYEALFELHDLKKEGFKRQLETGLDQQDFAHVFSAFCFTSYVDRRFEFSYGDLQRYVTKGVSLADHQFRIPKFNISDFCIDSEKNVALIIEDTGEFSFTHRLFQEYFVATFINDCQPEVQKKILGKFRNTSSFYVTDGCIDILNELNPTLVEQHFALPFLNELSDIIGLKKKVGITHYRKLIKWVFPTIKQKGHISVMAFGRWSLLMSISEALKKNGVINKGVERGFIGLTNHGRQIHMMVNSTKKNKIRRYDTKKDIQELFSSKTSPLNQSIIQELLDSRVHLSERATSFDDSFDMLFS